MLGYVVIDGVNVNTALIRLGLAWHYVEYNKDELLARMEFEAREAGRGLWSTPTQFRLGSFGSSSWTMRWNNRRKSGFACITLLFRVALLYRALALKPVVFAQPECIGY